MTGFGAVSGTSGTYRLNVEVRTVNHRFFNPSIKVPSALGRWENDLRERLRQRVARGHVTLVVRTERELLLGAAIDKEVFAAYADQLRRLSEQHGLGAPDAAAVLRLPGVVTSPTEEEPVSDVAQLVALVDAALDALDTMRRDEGKRMGEYLVARLHIFEEALQRIEARAPDRLVEQHARMRDAVKELMNGFALDEQRIAQEIAVLADRMDVAEELGRLRSHLRGFHSALSDESGEPIGKRLGFLLQEMLREVNTIGSKGADVQILHEVIQLKEELERMREQAENIE